MSSLPAGAVISHYRIIELIGRGGMGEVYKAVDQRLRRTVAMKIPHPALVGNERMSRRFLREAHTASLLSHPNICTIFEIGEENGQPFIVMEYIEGRTLKEIISAGAPPIEVAVSYAIQMADALGEAHRRGVLHRDLKPANIIVNRRGAPVLLDFGLAKVMRDFAPADEDSPTIMHTLTSEAALVGTVAYMSPEQARGQTLDARSDIFSFGIVLYEMLAGRRPFGGPSHIETLHAILHSEPRRLSEIKPGINQRLEEIIARAMHKDAGARYQSIEELKADLWRLAKEEGYELNSATLSGGVQVTTEKERAGTSTMTLPEWKQQGLWRTPLVWWATTIFLLAVIAGWWLWHRRQEAPTGGLTSLTPLQLTSWKSEIGALTNIHARFSRDGQYIAFASTQSGSPDIWIQQINGGEPERLRGTEGEWADSSPVWSPDGQIAFLSNRDNHLGIWTVPMLNGTPALVQPLEKGTHNLVAWSRDGKTIFYDSDGNLFALDLKTNHSSQLTRLKTDIGLPRGFSLAADEDRVAYVDEQNKQTDIWSLSLRTGQTVRITNDAAVDRNPFWHPDGQRMIYNCHHGNTSQICVVRLDGSPPVALPFSDSAIRITDISADGRRILYTTSIDESDLWGVRPADRMDAPKEFQVTSQIGAELWPDISSGPSGDGRMVFQATQSQNIGGQLQACSIFVKPLAGGGSQLRLAAEGFAPQWSPDGGEVAFLRIADRQTNLWTVKLASLQARQLTFGGITFGGFSLLPYNRFQTRDYQWVKEGITEGVTEGSAEGATESRAIIYCAIRSGISNLWQAAIGGSGESQLSNNTDPQTIFFNPLRSANRQQIAHLATKASPEGKSFWSIWLTEGGQSRQLFQSESALRLVGWLPSGQELLVKSVAGKRDASQALTPATVTLLLIPTNGGDARVIAKLDSTYFSNLQLSPDGQTVAFVGRQDGEDRLNTIPANGGKSRKLVGANDPRIYFSNLAWSPDSKTIYYGKQASWRVISIIDNLK